MIRSSLLAVALMACVSPAVAASAPAHRPAPGTPSRPLGALTGVDATSAHDVWAVGHVLSGQSVPVVLHSDGTGWTEMDAHVPPAAYGAVFDDVAALSPSDAWAVGGRCDENGCAVLADHWDGDAWTPVEAPTPGAEVATVAVSGTATDDVWMVGSFYGSDTTCTRQFAEHWDGTSWRRVALPRERGQRLGELTDVVALAGDDAWAVGLFDRSSCIVPGSDRSLTLHWDGDRWTHVKSPNRDANDAFHLQSVDGVDATHVWSVGSGFRPSPPGGTLTSVLSWDGRAWHRVRHPQPPPGGGPANTLNGVSTPSAGLGWAVGIYQVGAARKPLFERWSGRRWQQVKASNDVPGTRMSAVACLTADDAWAVGVTGRQGRSPLIEHWDGRHWTEQDPWSA